jgi:hypothetical protein
MVDITGIRGISELRSIHKRYIQNGIKTDKNNIASDFQNAFKKLKK